MHKSNWITATLEDICQSGGGLQTGPFGSQLHASEYTEEGVPVVMPKDLINWKISVATVARIPEERANDLKRHRLKTGDIVFGRRGDIGRCAIVTNTEAGWICGSGSLRVRLNNEVSPQYLIYYLGQPHVIHWLVSNAVGQTMLNLSAGILASLPIELPPLPEQRKIAEILSTWDEAIDLTAQLMAAKQRRKQALMQRLLTGQVRFPKFALSKVNLGENSLPAEWKTDVLANVAIFLDEQRKPIKQNDREKIHGIIPYYGASGIIDYVDDYIFDDELILLGEDGANILTRSTRLVFRVSGKCWVNNHAHVIKPKSNMDIDYLCEYLESLSYTQYNTGTAQPKLTKETCQSIRVVVPPLEEQIKISSVLRLCDEEIDLLQQKLTALRRQKQGLMQQLLTGKVRVQA